MSREFKTTRWSIVLRAAEGDSTHSQEALASLCQTYWLPLYSFVRRRGYPAEDARDLTQAYFTKLLEKEYLRQVEPSAGHFRSFLLTSLKNFLANEWDRSQTQKRGGKIPHLSLDVDEAERRFRHEPVDEWTPESAYERRWAMTVVEATMSRLEKEFKDRDQSDRYEHFRHHLTGRRPKKPYKQIAEELGVTENAIKVGVLRLRKRYGQLLREEIAQTVASPDDVDGELRYLLELLSR